MADAWMTHGSQLTAELCDVQPIDGVPGFTPSTMKKQPALARFCGSISCPVSSSTCFGIVVAVRGQAHLEAVSERYRDGGRRVAGVTLIAIEIVRKPDVASRRFLSISDVNVPVDIGHSSQTRSSDQGTASAIHWPAR